MRIVLGKRLELARIQAGLTQAQAAKLMGFNSRQIISSIEKGTRELKAEEAYKFSNIYDVSINWIYHQGSDIRQTTLELLAMQLAKLEDRDIDTLMLLFRSLKKDS